MSLFKKSSLAGLVRESPFHPIQEHMRTVFSCICLIPPLFDALYRQDFSFRGPEVNLLSCLRCLSPSATLASLKNCGNLPWKRFVPEISGERSAAAAARGLTVTIKMVSIPCLFRRFHHKLSFLAGTDRRLSASSPHLGSRIGDPPNISKPQLIPLSITPPAITQGGGKPKIIGLYFL